MKLKKDEIRTLFAAALCWISPAVVFAVVAGCSSPGFQAAEADVHAAFVAADALVVEGSANPEALKAAVDKAVSLDPTSKTLLSLQTKAHAAIDAGDLTTLHVLTAGAAAVTAPASTGLVPAKSP